MSDRQRIDLWLHHARFLKTRAAAARLVSEGGVRVFHRGVAKRLEKPSAEIRPGDALAFILNRRLISVRIVALSARRGPPAEARALYCELDADSFA